MRCSSASNRVLSLTLLLSGAIFSASALAQEPTTNDSTVTYPAEFFAQYEPFSVNDMLDRIPGIDTARGGGGGNGGPDSSSGGSRRGLGLGGDQILINGRRTAGKENEGNSQLSRIPANQVRYIEIIRGTSGELDVRGGSQVINIVLLEAESSASIAYEINADHLHDGELKPGGRFSLTGQRGALDYLFSAESEPRWERRKGYENSFLADGTPNDYVSRVTTTDSQPLVFSANLGYEFGENDIAHINAQLENRDAPSIIERTIFNFVDIPRKDTVQFDDTNQISEFWEIGGLKRFSIPLYNSAYYPTLEWSLRISADCRR